MAETGRDGGERASGHISLSVVVVAPADGGAAGSDPSRMAETGRDGGERAVGRISPPGVVVAPADGGAIGSDPARMEVADGDGGERCCLRLWLWAGLVGPAGWLWAGLVGAAAGNQLGVDVELAAVRVEERFLALDQPVPHLEVALGRVLGTAPAATVPGSPHPPGTAWVSTPNMQR